MRFSLKPISFAVLCAFAPQAGANVDWLALRMDKTFMAMAEPQQETPSFVEADRIEGKQGEQIEATGNAVLRKHGQSIRADKMLYFQTSSELDAQGSVVLEQAGNTMSGPHLHLNLDTSVGTMEQPTYFLAETQGRGAADVMHIQDKQHYTLDNATYTTCAADNEDWTLKMRGLELDREQQVGVAHHAWVEFMGVPILYSPYMDFPLGDGRKSGLLSPIFGGTSKGGTELTLPYYWNIAPNYDATISPRLMTKRGLMLNNEFRYLNTAYRGEMHLDMLPNDKVANQNRGRFSLNHNQTLAEGWTGYVNFNRVSDNAYFRDLADGVTTTSQVNLSQEGGVTYGGGWWTAVARVQQYQTLQDPAAPIAIPYARLPQLTLNASQNYAGATFALASEYVDFSHPTALNAQRLVIAPSVAYPLVSAPAYYVTPKLTMHSTHYVMGVNNLTALANASRTLPIFSLDSGMAFERDLNLFGTNYLNTLEPRAFYSYVPYKDQSLLPNFDSAQADFNFVQMFSENRFFGSDRVGDANQLTLAVTTRFLEQANGAERLKLTLGERFSVQAPRVNLIAPTTTSNRSDVLLAATGQLTDAWSLDSEFQYDPNQSHTQRYNMAARYRPEPGKALNLGYRFARNALRQVDLSAQWPLSSRWHAVGRWNYSLQDNRILEAIAGLEYNQSCWMLRLVMQRFTVGTQQANTGFFVQLELNDFVKLGSDPLSVLKNSVPGYTKLNDKPIAAPMTVLH